MKLILEFDDVWLEVKACRSSIGALRITKRTLKVPAISEVLEAAANANSRSGIWWYSRRLYKEETEVVRSVLVFHKTVQNNRSTSLSLNVKFKGSCYTITLFEVKRSQ